MTWLRLGVVTGVLAIGVACSEYRVDDPDPIPPEPPPEDDETGGPPDNWLDCSSGYLGLYYNLRGQNPDVGPEAPPAPTDPDDVAWWTDDDLAFSKYDPTLDFGENWWPVDEGLEGDPAYFSGRWHAWVRVWSGGNVRFLVGAADDAWVRFSDDILVAVNDAPVMDPQPYDVNVSAGQYPVTVYYAHRKADAAGFRFRILDGDLTLCYPEYGEEQ